MTEIEQKLLEEMTADFQGRYNGQPKIKAYGELVKNGTATIKDAQLYAEAIATLTQYTLSDFASRIKGEEDVYDALMKFIENNNYELVNDYSVDVLSVFHKKYGIGLKAQDAEFNRNAASGLANKLNHATDDAEFQQTSEMTENFSKKVVDDAVFKDADFLYRSGVDIKIVRINSNHSCSFCERLAGVYGYRSERSFRAFDNARHDGCHCTVMLQADQGFKKIKVPTRH